MCSGVCRLQQPAATSNSDHTRLPLLAFPYRSPGLRDLAKITVRLDERDGVVSLAPYSSVYSLIGTAAR